MPARTDIPSRSSIFPPRGSTISPAALLVTSVAANCRRRTFTREGLLAPRAVGHAPFDVVANSRFGFATPDGHWFSRLLARVAAGYSKLLRAGDITA